MPLEIQIDKRGLLSVILLYQIKGRRIYLNALENILLKNIIFVLKQI